MSQSDASLNPQGAEIFPRYQAVMVSVVLVCSTLLGLAGTDLVLPAVPQLPSVLSGSVAQAQLVLATFAAGTGFGLLLFGELGARYDHRPMLTIALFCYGLLSLVGGMAESLQALILVRFFQGFAASCAAVVAPGMIRAMFSEKGALRAIGLLGSVESLAPAVAPIIGLWLFSLAGWTASFFVTAFLAVLLAIAVLLVWKKMPDSRRYADQSKSESADKAMPHSSAVSAVTSSYFMLLGFAPYLRYALSQAFALGGLLVFVFAAPVVIIDLGGDIQDFIVMQICGITSFIIAANSAGKLVEKYGSNQTIWLGTALCLLGVLAIFVYAMSGGNNLAVIWLLFVPMNMGLGFRGPPSFYQALVQAGGDDARASALLILFVMLITALGTSLVAFWIDLGLWLVALAAALLILSSALCLKLFSVSSESRLKN